MSVHRLVHWLAGYIYFRSRTSLFQGLQKLITAPAQPNATEIAVYTALFLGNSLLLRGDTNFISVIHNIESILGITVQNALNTVDDEAAESNMDADDDDEDDDEDDDDSTDSDDDDDEDVDAANFIVAPVAEPRE